MTHSHTCTCASCGSSTEFLDYGYQLPDSIWQLPNDQRGEQGKSFAKLGERRFVRCLFPIKLENGREFRYGLWLEVDASTYRRIFDVWDDEPRYAVLTFEGRIANAAPPWRARIMNVLATASVRDPSVRPFVASSSTTWLQKILDDGWTMIDYEVIARELLGR